MLKSVNADFRIDILFRFAVHKNIYTMIYANHLYNLATSKPRITMAEIEAMCLEKAKQGEMYCWVFNPIAEDDIEKLITNGFEIEKHNNSSYRIDWAKPSNL